MHAQNPSRCSYHIYMAMNSISHQLANEIWFMVLMDSNLLQHFLYSCSYKFHTKNYLKRKWTYMNILCMEECLCSGFFFWCMSIACHTTHAKIEIAKHKIYLSHLKISKLGKLILMFWLLSTLFLIWNPDEKGYGWSGFLQN